MNPKLHLWLCLAIVVAGFGASIALALSASPPAAIALAASAYGLSALGHYSLIGMLPKHPGRMSLPLALLWPLVDLWFFAHVALPAAELEEEEPGC